MDIQLIQIPPLQKFRPTDSFFDRTELREQTVLRGERLCYQVCIRSDVRQSVTVSLESELAPHLKLYLVKNVVMDVPARTGDFARGGLHFLLSPVSCPTCSCRSLSKIGS